MSLPLFLVLAITAAPAGVARVCTPPAPGKRVHIVFGAGTDLMRMVEWARTTLCVEYAVPSPLADRRLSDQANVTLDGADAGTAFELLLHTMNVRVEGRGPSRKVVAAGDDPALARAAALATQVTKLDATHYAISRDVFDALVVEGHRWLRVVPELADGKVRGVRLSSIKPDGVPARLGLVNGDLVKSVNGLALTDPATMLEAYAKTRAADKVTFGIRRGARDVTIEWRLLGAPPPAAPPPPPGAATAADDPRSASLAAQITKQDDTHYTIPRAALLELLDSGLLGRPVRIVPEIRDGKPAGFRLFGVRPASVYGAVGIQNGDVVRAVNDVPLVTPDSVLSVYRKRASINAYRLSLERFGKPLTIEVKVK